MSSLQRISKAAFSVGVGLTGLLMFASPAFAGVSGSAGPTYPSTVNVGDTGVPVSLQIINNSTAPQNTETILVTSIFHTPSCGSGDNATCAAINADPGVFQITGPVTGHVGTACEANTFAVGTPDAITGEVQFTPNAPIVLASSSVGGAAATCVIDFQVDVLKAPTKDANASAGIQTAQLAKVHFLAQTSLVDGAASGSSQVAVAKASPTIATVQSVGGNIGTVLNDTATLSGGTAPTGDVTFKLYQPSDLSCAGPEVFSQTDSAAPYATGPGYTSLVAGVYHWTADYAGDANNNAVSSGCADEPVTVLAQGHIVVDKVTNPAADDQSFAFTATGGNYSGFSLTDVATPNDQALDAGSYSVAETAVVGWTQTSATCLDGQDAIDPASITLVAGHTVTCTFTNTKMGHLIVEKATVPAGDATVFTIAASGTGTITGGGAGTVTDATDKNYEVTPGTYSVAETVPTGWTKTGDTCQSVVVGAGETKTCLITNAKGGTVIVKKVMVGGTSTFAFTGSLAGSISTNNGTISLPVEAGQYVSTETPKAGWTLTSVVCNDTDSVGNSQNGTATFNVAAGESVTCTFTNIKQTGNIIIVKQTNPDGDPQSFEFDSSYGSNFNLVDNGQNDSGALDAGTYSVAEVNIPANWAQSNVTCSDGSSPDSINLAAGETVTCTFTNTYTAPPAGEYCSPGYWKQSQHFDSWVEYAPTDLFSSVFEGATISWSSKGKPGPVADPTLLQVLEGKGGGVTSLARAAVGALLNASALESSLSEQDVIDIFNAANPDGNFEAAKASYTFSENCPLN